MAPGQPYSDPDLDSDDNNSINGSDLEGETDVDSELELNNPPPSSSNNHSFPNQRSQQNAHAAGALSILRRRGRTQAYQQVAENSDPPICVVCQKRPQYSKGGKHYPTCGLTCAAQLKNSTIGARPLCVVCRNRPQYSNGAKSYPTCGLTCARKLATLCDYCHQQPKNGQFDQCGKACAEKAKRACLLCHSRPRHGKYHFCGRTCRDNAMKTLPLLLEAKPGHETFEMVKQKFEQSWRFGQPPTVQRVYKVVESRAFLAPYDTYRKRHKNEKFRYHGTSRSCNLGVTGKICSSSSCPACSILRTSYQVSLANPGGAFGRGIYTSSSSNKSAGYSPNGIMFLNKVVLGKEYNVSNFAEVNSCPVGYNSVVFDRQNGSLNETVVYRNDAIRPVFLIVFA